MVQQVSTRFTTYRVDHKSCIKCFAGRSARLLVPYPLLIARSAATAMANPQVVDQKLAHPGFTGSSLDDCHIDKWPFPMISQRCSPTAICLMPLVYKLFNSVECLIIHLRSFYLLESFLHIFEHLSCSPILL